MKSIRIENIPLRDYKVTHKKRGKEFLDILKSELGTRDLKPETPFESTYTVEKGDNLTKIVKNFLNTTKFKGNITQLVAQLGKDNGLKDPDFILEGQKLNISSLIAQATAERVNFSHVEIFSTQNQNFTSTASKPFIMDDGLRRISSGVDYSKKLLQLIHKISSSHRMNPYLSTAVARAESGVSANYERRILLDPYAVSPDFKSKGLYQLIDKTGKRFHEMLGLAGRYNPFNIWQNIKMGIGYLEYLDKIFTKETVLTENLNTTPILDSSERKYFSIAAFNSGEGRVAQAQQLAKEEGKDPRFFKNIEKYLPHTTQMYVKKVLKFIRNVGVRS